MRVDHLAVDLGFKYLVCGNTGSGEKGPIELAVAKTAELPVCGPLLGRFLCGRRKSAESLSPSFCMPPESRPIAS